MYFALRAAEDGILGLREGAGLVLRSTYLSIWHSFVLHPSGCCRFWFFLFGLGGVELVCLGGRGT